MRLPVEQEWELAAGGTDPEGRCPWDRLGEAMEEKTEIEKRANVGSGIGGTSSVAMFAAGKSYPHEIMDMAGNVWE